MSDSQPIVAELEFIIWAEDQLNCRSLSDADTKLKSLSKVDLGRLYKAYVNKEEAPADLVPKPVWVTYELNDLDDRDEMDTTDAHTLDMRSVLENLLFTP